MCDACLCLVEAGGMPFGRQYESPDIHRGRRIERRDGVAKGAYKKAPLTLTLVAVGAEVVGLHVLEGEQGAGQGKRDNFKVASHGFLWVVLLVSRRVSATRHDLLPDFEFCGSCGEGGMVVWSGESVGHLGAFA